jgi:hypothetical protein
MVPKRGMMQGQRAQITVFMIVGIILLFSSALLFYIRGQIVSGIPSEFIPTIEEVPLEAQPVKIFVEDCVQKVATEALVQIGLHGGYINPNDFELSGKVMRTAMEPTESDMLTFSEGNSQTNIPYWWYLKSRNRCGRAGLEPCQYGSNKPALTKESGLNSVEGQLDTYIKLKMDGCLDGFAGFKKQGFVINVKGPFKPDARVAEKEVIILLEYPISVEREGRLTDMRSFFTKVDINMKKVYTLADFTSRAQGRYALLESNLLNMITLFSIPVSVNKIPPIAHQTIDPSEFYVWTRTETQQRLESLVLPHYVRQMVVEGTKNYDRMIILSGGKVNDVASGVVAGFVWPLTRINKTQLEIPQGFRFGNLEASFAYSDWWPIYLNINDREILKGDSFGNDFFPLLSMKNYVFGYDVSYPVVVTIHDPDSLEGRGYDFLFAMEGNIRGGAPLMPDVTVSTPPTPVTDSLACNDNQRNSALIKVITVDAIRKKPVEGAMVEFVMGGQPCFMGNTKMDENNESTLTAKFPIGIGSLKVTKKDYLLYDKRFTPTTIHEVNKTVYLYPEVSINATVQALTLSYAGGGSYILPPGMPISSLSPKEEAFITFSRVSDEGEDFDYTTILIFKGDQTSPSIFKIVPGRYELLGNIILNSPIRIPREERTYDVPFSDDQTIVANETNMDSMPSGGIELNNITGYMEIKQDDLLNSKQVVFYMVRFPLPLTHSQEFKDAPSLEALGKVPDYSNLYRTELNPRWIR